MAAVPIRRAFFRPRPRASGEAATINSQTSKSDHETFVRCLLRDERTIRAFLRSMLPSACDVDEVMQEVSVVAWRKFGDLDDTDNFCKWVCAIARFEVLMYRRKKARDRFVLDESVERLIAEEGLEELELREKQLSALNNCLKKLPSNKRNLIVLVYSSRRSMISIAEELGKTPESIYKAMSRLRKLLLDCISQQLPEVSP